MSTAPIDSSFYADPQGVNALRRDARANDPDAVKEAARQFEALFTSMMLKSMRDATPKGGLFDSDQQDFYQDMFDQQLATQLSKGKGLGLADSLVQQLMRTGLQAPEKTHATTLTAAAGTLGAVDWPPASREDFVQSLKPAAEAAGRQLGVDPETLIAHAALETGWGRKLPRNADGSSSFNLFGIKAGGAWAGPVATARTTEFVGGQSTQLEAGFRSYASPEDAMQDYASLLSTQPRYARAVGTGSDVRAFATALQQGGYATDPAYASKLQSVAETLKSPRDLPLT